MTNDKIPYKNMLLIKWNIFYSERYKADIRGKRAIFDKKMEQF